MNRPAHGCAPDDSKPAPVEAFPSGAAETARTATACCIIPARYDSARFPGKMLADRTGQPLIRHVYERARRAKRVGRILVATDDDRIARAVRAFGGEAIMTRRDHPNGTSRLAEVAATICDAVIVNVQGDEPEIEPDVIDAAISALLDHPDCPMATVASPFGADENPRDPNIVKVVVDRRGHALYFSRSLIPCDRDGVGGAGGAGGAAAPLKHVGVYAYRRAFLDTFARLPPTPLELTERLEQLRALEHGHAIAVALGEARSHGIDTPEQYEAFVRRWRLARSAEA